MSAIIGGINHFALSVGDLKESIAFYTEILGLEICEQRENDCFLKVGEKDVMALIQFPEGRFAYEGTLKPKRTGKSYTHFGFEAPSIEAVYRMERKLYDAGVKIVTKAYERWDGASLYFLDPNGYTIEYLYFAPEKASK